MTDRQRAFLPDSRPLTVAAVGVMTALGVLLGFMRAGTVPCSPPVLGRAAPYPQPAGSKHHLGF